MYTTPKSTVDLTDRYFQSRFLVQSQSRFYRLSFVFGQNRKYAQWYLFLRPKRQVRFLNTTMSYRTGRVGPRVVLQTRDCSHFRLLDVFESTTDVQFGLDEYRGGCVEK